MKLHTIVASLALTIGLASAQPAEAKKGYKNLKVLKDTGKDLKKGMKKLTKGLGVKCKSCHIKGKWDKDDVQVKDTTRKFLKAVVGETDQGKKDAALKALLKALDKPAAKDADLMWSGVSMFQKK